MKRLDYYWYNKSFFTLLLLPVSWLFCAIVLIRRLMYRIGILKAHRQPVPVVIVGNLTVGGAGKTPFVIWLVQHLKENGFNPGIVSRGYRGKAAHWPQQVRPDSDPRIVGDEAILLARRCQCPMSVGPKRAIAVAALLKHTNCDIIVSDDGLQHYALSRDIEIAIIDGVRRLGNGHCLPAGPLREPSSRLTQVDFVISNGVPGPREYPMTLKPGSVTRLNDAEKTCSLSAFKGQDVHGVAGIGNPERFFKMLEDQGVHVVRHPFPDHYAFSADDICFDDDLPVLMTEKDAVKCYSFADHRHWFIPVNAQIDERMLPLILRALLRTTGK